MEFKKVKKSRKVIFAILSVFCIVLSFLSPITSFAANSYNLMDMYGFSSDDILNQNDFELSDEYINGLDAFCDKTDSSYTNCVSYISSDKYSFTDSDISEPDSLYFLDCEKFALINDSNTSTLVTGDETCFLFYDGSTFYYYLSKDFLDTYYSTLSYSVSDRFFYLFRFQNGNPLGYFSNYQGLGNTTYNVDGSIYYRTSFGDYSTAKITNMPIYYNGTSSLTTLDGCDNLNYSSLGVQSTPVEDHETLRSGSGIYLNNTTCDDGDVVIVVIPDNTQTTNNGYKIRYGVQCTYVINLPNTTNSNTISMKNTLSRYGINANVGNNSVSGVYYYMDYAYRDIDIDEIGKSGGEVEDLKTTNERLKCNGVSISNLASKVSSDGNWTDSATDMLASGTTMVKGLTIPGYGSIDIDTNGLASLFTADYSVTSINYTFTLSLLKNSEVVATNYYPYTLASSDGNTGATTPYGNLIGSDSDYESAGTKNMSNGGYNQAYAPANDVSVTGGGGSSSSSNNSSQGGSGGDANVTNTEGDNNVVVHTGSQNVTVNNDNGTAKYVPTILNKLLPNSEGDGGLSNDVQDLVNSNGWVTFMKTTYSFIPSAFWDKIVLYFGACLTITACAFLLRIILDLL